MFLCYWRDGKSSQLQMRANNNKGGEFVKKADKPVVIVNGNNNDVDVKVIVMLKPTRYIPQRRS